MFLSLLLFKVYGLDFKIQKTLFIESFLGFSIAFLCTSPLYLIGGLGGGDVKFFSVFGFLHHGVLVLETFVYSLCWAFVFGFFVILFQKNLKVFLKNLVNMNFYLNPEKAHRIPFSFPFLMGWLSYILINTRGVL